ncbi:MFS transporter [Brevibacillus sp. SYSU BS000544]|uniref:MFS transporter n=1 Tax=Brevibacillus sp. SYSU BS000544 TaxID=3416443 RepID=UPI003CE4DF0F
MDKEQMWSRNFISLCICCFFVYICFYSLLPTLPIYAKEAFHVDNTQIGLLLTTYALAALVSRPFAGVWMDRFGKKQLLFVSTIVYLVASFLYLVVGNFWALILLRVVHGFSFGIATSVTGTIAADILPKTRMGEGLGYYGMFISMSMVIGPFLGLTLIQYTSFPVLFMILTVCSLLSVICTMLIRLVPQQRTTHTFSLRQILEKSSIPIALCGFLLAFAYGGITAFVSVFGNSLGLMEITNYFFAAFALLVVLPRPFLGKLFDRKGANSIVYPGILIFVAGEYMLSQTGSSFWFLASAAVLGLGYGALFPSFQTLAVQAAPAHRKGFATSTFLFFYDAGIAIGSLLLGLVAERTNYHNMYSVSTAVVTFTIVLYFFLHHKRVARRAGKQNAPVIGQLDS